MDGAAEDSAHGGRSLDRTPFSGSRLSGPRRVILDVVQHMACAFTVDELAKAVRSQRSGVGTATVYRAVASMESSGYVEVVGARGESALYARCDHHGHHHHLVCTGCGATATAECDLAETIEASARDAGFVVTRHELSLYGLCSECAERPQKGA